MESPVTEKTDLVSFSITSNGSPIDGTYQVISIQVTKDLNKIPRAQIKILDGSASQETFTISSSQDFVPGNEIEVKAGYQGQEQSIFKGIIIKHGISAGQGRGSMLEIECRDKSIKATVARKNAYFTQTTDSDVISQLLGNYGLSADVDSTSPQLKEIIQYYSTDWDFVLSRAEVNGLVVNANAGQVTVKAPNTSASAQLKVTYGDDILEFEAKIDAQWQLPSVTTNAWDMSSQAVVNSDSSEPSLNSQGNLKGTDLADVIGLSEYDLQTTGVVPQDSLKAWANGKLLKSRLALMRGEVAFQGSSLAEPDTILEIEGVGDRFDGSAYITGVTHRIENGNWITEARFGLPHDWFADTVEIEAPPASGLLPGMSGLHTAVVKQIDQDPDNEFRVLVTLPMIQSGDDGVWARLSTYYATNSAGFYFYPEVGDEVVVGFMNEDPRFPIILGSVYSSSNAAPFTPDSENGTKAIVTKNQLVVNFDDQNKVITINTPGGNKIVLTDQDEGITIQDQNNNKAEFSSSGITIQSASSMTLKAAESVTIQGASISVKADQSVSVQGMSVSLSADTEMKASGSASAEFSSSGQCSVKGSVVMIN